jgi:hypothetical protein
MPRFGQPKPANLLEQIPSLDQLTRLQTRLEMFKEKEEMAKVILKQFPEAIEQHRKTLGTLIRELESPAGAAVKPVTSIKDLQFNLTTHLRSVKNALVTRGLEGEYKKAADEKGLVKIATSVLEMLKELPTEDDFLKSVTSELSRLLNLTKKAQSRVQAGGHEVFDEKVTKVISHLWKVHDNGYDVLMICLRNQEVVYDALLSERSKVKTPLRFEVQLNDPNAKPPPPKAKKPKKAPVAVTPPATPPTTPPATPTTPTP